MCLCVSLCVRLPVSLCGLVGGSRCEKVAASGGGQRVYGGDGGGWK